MTKQSTPHDERFHNFHCSHHPLIAHKLSLLRDAHLPQQDFSALIYQITLMLIYEATQSCALTKTVIQTPLEKHESSILSNEDFIITPILRAGLGMVNAFSTLLPKAKIGHIGFKRNEKTLQPEKYYCNLPPHQESSQFLICDPMLATGGTAIAAANLLRQSNAKHISLICIVAAPEGVTQFQQAHPDIAIYSASLDRELNSTGYILPGLGDAGDRLFGTL